MERYFEIGDIIDSGGRKTQFEVMQITDANIRIQPTASKTASRLSFERLALVVQNFHRIDATRIEKSVGEVLEENGTRDTQNESYLYGFAREYLSRASHPLVSIEAKFQRAVTRSLNGGSAQRRERLKVAPKRPKRIAVSTFAFERNPDVVAEVLARANGFCEAPNCKMRAPFMRKSNGSPYLEVHHRKPLAEEGEDTVENAIALCPNCHRESHFG